MRFPHRSLLRLALAVSVLLGPSALADGREVPVTLQMRLAAKVASYDRNMKQRVSDGAHILVVQRGAAEAKRLARRVKSTIDKTKEFAGTRATVELYTYENPAALASKITSSKIALAYFAGGFEEEAKAIAGQLDGTSVLTLSSELSAVRAGIVLGIGLKSGRPKLYLNLPQATKQKVQIAPRLIKLMEVYR